MTSKVSWTAEADRDLLVAMAMTESGSKPSPKWDKVQTIMEGWGYGFTSSAMYQHFSKQIWKQIVQKRGEAASAKPAPASPDPKKRSRKKPKAAEKPEDSDSDLDRRPPKKAKLSVKKGRKVDEEEMTVKDEVKEECV
ncbi:uncharacterized protein DNG_08439 [Cephalotrichum gorgonifer]|uniref:Myb-like domain-containing protein n=1 Tax=Cephalotrichum gorgonifer TaxID=2041049 RepID=A0AAE8N4B4_9PEZI|nr:uncharacterized protein DNG_08439 [Cephalotrichum gorgonifer]